MAVKRKKIGRWIFIAAIFILIGVTITGNLNVYRVHQQTRRLRERIRDLNRQIDSLSIEITRLRSDTSYIEYIAREKLGMARPDERVYKFVEEAK